ncbi:MAG: hypothetical protein R3E32_13965 [Chitinophagales bacterium]
MKSKDKNILRGKVISKLYPYYEEKGFIFKKTIANFVKNDFWVLWGEASTHIDSLVFRPQLWVFNESIKSIMIKVFNNKNQLNSVIHRGQSNEFAQEMGIKKFKNSRYNYKSEGGESYFYNIEMETNLSPIIADHIDFMDKVGIPFFEKNNTLKGIDEYLNNRILKLPWEILKENNLSNLLVHPLHKREVLSGIIAAHLIENPRLKELTDKYIYIFNENNYILDDLKKILLFFEDYQKPISI